MNTPEQTWRLRQFYGRVVFGIGAAYGTINSAFALLLIVLADGSTRFAILFAAFSFGAACWLAFWKRRVASIWLLLAGIFVVSTILMHPEDGGRVNPRPDKSQREMWSSVKTIAEFAAGPLLIGCFGLITDLARWPPLQNRKRLGNSYRPPRRMFPN